MSKIDLDKFVCSLYEHGREYKYFEDAITLALKNQGLQMKDGEISEIKPKFKVGDWIVFNGLTLYIKEVVKGYYRTISQGGITNSYDWNIDNAARLWTIQDAKDGDVLVSGKQLFLFKRMNTSNSFYAHCNYHFIGYDSLTVYDCSYSIDNICPATKKQRDVLMKAIADAGYTFDFEKKELINEIDEPFDDLELTLYDYLSSDTCGEIPPEQMRRTVKARAREIREKLR